MSPSMTTGGAGYRSRLAGAFYLGEMIAHSVGVVIRGRYVVSADAAATAANVTAHAPLFRLAFATDLAGFACYVVVTALLYGLFKPVNRSVSLLAAFFSLVGCTVGAISCLFTLAPFLALGGAQYLGVFTVPQLQALALLFFKLYVQCFNISFVFFGFYCVLIGYLILRSAFLPRVIGVLMAIAGCGWLVFLSPTLARSLSPFLLISGGLGEGSLTLWLLVAGVNAERWKEQAGFSASEESD